MCRFLAYTGESVFLDKLLIEPASSLVNQSLAAREAKTVVNGDGCGVGWYGARLEPGCYRGTLPAWSDANLASLCHQVSAPMFLAHVRSATSGEVSMANCHPFVAGRHLFMHNGQIGGYDRIRRSIEAVIPDDLYAKRRGNGDSEAIFLAALGNGLALDPVAAVAATLGICLRIMASNDVTTALRFTAILADGETLRAFRWSSDDHPPSLYWRQMDAGIAIASEPFGDSGDHWETVPPSSVMTAGRDNVSFSAFAVV
ncbi:class II glutamine amidotransferase [Devosia sp. 2618]|uniref:class II glutamine amidotransferase n=1 Tax=Devosia sp. 2618 TaxID=3156454 RepID=UPI003396114C